MPFDPELQAVAGIAVPSQRYVDYRRLSHAILADDRWYWNYKVVGVALSKESLVVLAEAEIAGLSDALKPLTSEGVRLLASGPIVTTVSGGESVGAGAGAQASGTFGCIVEDTLHVRYGLSCDHVVGAVAGQSIGDPVWAPSKARGGSATSKIGAFKSGSGIVLSASASNKVDGALIDLTTPAAHPPAIAGIAGAPRGTNRSISFGDMLKKSGVATGVTDGEFTYIVTLNVPYGTAGTARFVDQIGIDGGGIVFADKGDSGAVVLDSADRVVGLLFAAAPKSFLGFANFISDVETSLGVTAV